MQQSSPFLSLAQIADLLGIDRTTAYRMASRGEFPTYRVGRQIRVRREDLEEYLCRQRVPSSHERALQARGKVVALRPRVELNDDLQRAREAARRLGWPDR